MSFDVRVAALAVVVVLAVAGCGSADASSSHRRPRPSPSPSASPSPSPSASPSPSPSPSVSPSSTSGLAWPSGVDDPTAEFGTWRGRTVDTSTTWPNRGTWAEVENPDVYGAVTAKAGVPSLSIGMFPWPTSIAGTFAQVNAGTYDAHYRAYGTHLAAVRPGATVRLMWEYNLESYPYFIGSDTAGFVAAFDRIVTQIRTTDPAARFDWNPNKDNHGTLAAANVLAGYPGDAYVDSLGPDFYNMYPDYPDAAAWTAGLDATQNGGPLGLNGWAAFARAHGKLLSIPEWGPATGNGGATDSPAYIAGMHDFFAANAAIIGQEVEFNSYDPYRIYPRPSGAAGTSPLSSDQYLASWR